MSKVLRAGEGRLDDWRPSVGGDGALEESLRQGVEPTPCIGVLSVWLMPCIGLAEADAAALGA
eukprot:964922-Amphidinium_carterae.3